MEFSKHTFKFKTQVHYNDHALGFTLHVHMFVIYIKFLKDIHKIENLGNSERRLRRMSSITKEKKFIYSFSD